MHISDDHIIDTTNLFSWNPLDAEVFGIGTSASRKSQGNRGFGGTEETILKFKSNLLLENALNIEENSIYYPKLKDYYILGSGNQKVLLVFEETIRHPLTLEGLGTIFLINASGESKVIFNSNDDYVLSVVEGNENDIYFAVQNTDTGNVIMYYYDMLSEILEVVLQIESVLLYPERRHFKIINLCNKGLVISYVIDQGTPLDEIVSYEDIDRAAFVEYYPNYKFDEPPIIIVDNEDYKTQRALLVVPSPDSSIIAVHKALQANNIKLIKFEGAEIIKTVEIPPSYNIVIEENTFNIAFYLRDGFFDQYNNFWCLTHLGVANRLFDNNLNDYFKRIDSKDESLEDISNGRFLDGNLYFAYVYSRDTYFKGNLIKNIIKCNVETGEYVYLFSDEFLNNLDSYFVFTDFTVKENKLYYSCESGSSISSGYVNLTNLNNVISESNKSISTYYK